MNWIIINHKVGIKEPSGFQMVCSRRASGRASREEALSFTANEQSSSSNRPSYAFHPLRRSFGRSSPSPASMRAWAMPISSTVAGRLRTVQFMVGGDYRFPLSGILAEMRLYGFKVRFKT